MSPRRVVTGGTLRCPECRFMPRWCICPGLRKVESPVAIDVVMHPEEMHRPTSTGLLIGRVVVGARLHGFDHRAPIPREDVIVAGREPWILHPYGEAMPEGRDPGQVQLILLDGNWREAAHLRRRMEGWGRLVRLPETGAGSSRYWLRKQSMEGCYSTVEALMQVLRLLACAGVADVLQVQAELLVYAGLLSRGAIAMAAEYLEGSPLPGALPDMVRILQPGSGRAAIIPGRPWNRDEAAIP